jgi:hypothetical protein
VTSDQFVFWLQGFFEISQQSNTPNERQVEEIRNNLNLVVTKDIPNITANDDRQLKLPFFKTNSTTESFRHTGD